MSMGARDPFDETARCMRMLYHGIVTTKRHSMNMAGDGRLFRFSRTASQSRDVSSAGHRGGRLSLSLSDTSGTNRSNTRTREHRYAKGTERSFFYKIRIKLKKNTLLTNGSHIGTSNVQTTVAALYSRANSVIV